MSTPTPKTLTELFNEGAKPEILNLPYPNKPAGVEGWLAWLVLSLFVISPAASAWLVYSSTTPLQAQLNADRYASVLHIYWGIWAARTAICWLMAWLLYKRFKRSTRFIVMALLWVAVVLPEWIGYMICIFEQQTDWLKPVADGAFEEVARMFVPTTVWTAYLAISKRVQNTYLA